MSFVELEKGTRFPLNTDPFRAGPKLFLRMCTKMAAAEEYIANIHEASETQLALIVFHVGLSYAQSRTPCFSEMSSAVQEWKPTLIPQVLPGENEEKCKQSNVSVTTA